VLLFQGPFKKGMLAAEYAMDIKRSSWFLIAIEEIKEIFFCASS
jgi:hypothetical protein